MIWLLYTKIRKSKNTFHLNLITTEFPFIKGWTAIGGFNKMEMTIFCGIQATGKTSFYYERFSNTHALISLDQLKTRGKEKKEIISCFQQKQSIVIDNTNVSVNSRKEYIRLAKDNHYTITGYYFQSELDTAINRNRKREERNQVPEIALRMSYKKLDVPTYSEGFDKLYGVSIGNDVFHINEWAKYNFSDVASNIKQFIGVNWIDKLPYLRLYDIKNHSFEKVPAIGYINIKKQNMKICTGYYDLHEAKAYPCSNQAELTHSNLDVCRDCNELMGFRHCVMCRGNICKATNSDALVLCEREHILYLAYFPDNKVKVRTTLMERRYERVLEQGAIFSLFIASANGREIRKIENAVSKLGITPQVAQKYKLRNVFNYTDSVTAQQELYEKLDFIKSQLSKEFTQKFITPEFNDFGYLQNSLSCFKQSDGLNKCPSYEVLDSVDAIAGNIVAVIGNVGVVVSDEKITAVNLKDLSGWLVEIDKMPPN
jgi:predicted kinase